MARWTILVCGIAIFSTRPHCLMNVFIFNINLCGTVGWPATGWGWGRPCSRHRLIPSLLKSGPGTIRRAFCPWPERAHVWCVALFLASKALIN